MWALASLTPLRSTSTPWRRNFSTTSSIAPTAVISQRCACETSIVTRFSGSEKSKALMKLSVEAKNISP